MSLMLKSPAQWGSTAYLVQILTTTKILSYDFRADIYLSKYHDLHIFSREHQYNFLTTSKNWAFVANKY